MKKLKKIYLIIPVIIAPLLVASTAYAIGSGTWTSSLSSLKTTTGLPNATITDIIKNIMLWLLYILGFIGIIGFVISGVMYLLSAGDETMAGRAKKGMTYSIIGIIVALSGLVIITAVSAILGGAETA